MVLFAIGTRGKDIPFVGRAVKEINGNALYHCVIFIPVYAARVPINRPRFFYFRVLLLRVRCAVIYSGYFGAFIVISHRPVSKRSTRTNACTSRAVDVCV